MNKTFASQEKTENGIETTTVSISKVGSTTVVETEGPGDPKTVMVTRKPRKAVDLKAAPKQTEDTPKTKKRYFYEKTGNYVSYARAKQLGLVD